MSAEANLIKGSVLITGASTGIGRACAFHLDRTGFRVFAGVRKEKDGEALKVKASSRLTPIIIDVTEAGSIAKAAEVVAEAVGDAGLYGLVNNAGIVVVSPLELLPRELLEKQLKVNVIGQIMVTQAFLPLIRNAHGRIVNIGSDNGKASWPFSGSYCASKFAIEALTDALRMELRPFGISVSLIEPGSIATPLWDKSTSEVKELLQRLPEDARDLYGRELLAVVKIAEKMGKMAIPPERVARAVTHALTARRPKARYVVGLDARIHVLMARILPDRIRDWILLGGIKVFGRIPT